MSVNKFLSTLLWLCNEAVSGLLTGWLGFITMTLLLILLLSVALSITRVKEVWKQSFFGVFSQFLFFPLIAAIGVIWWNDSGPAPPKNVPPAPIAEYLLLFFQLASLVIGGYFVYRMKRLRFLSISIFILNQWLLFHIGFVVGMAITSVWL